MISTWPFWTLIYQNKTKSLFTLFFSIIAANLFPPLAQAQAPLSFHEAGSYKERKVISFTQKEQQTPDIKYVLSSIDLNGDSLDEYITRPKSCTINTMCPYHIVAFIQDNAITLLTTQARKIIVKDTHRYGVRDILVFNNEMNDFQKSRYAWNPYTYIYEQKD